MGTVDEGSDTKRNILTDRQRCTRECRRTWHSEHGGAVPGGPFPGTNGRDGDVYRCEHGRYWKFRYTQTGGFSWFDIWEPLSWLQTPIDRFRARRAEEQS